MKIKFFLPVMLVLSVFGSLKAQDSVVSPKGVRYRIFNDAPGRTANTGDIIIFNFALFTGEDSLLFSTYGQGEPLTFQVEKAKFSGDFMDGLQLLSKGDSANIWVSSDSMRKFTPVDSYIKPGSYLRYNVKVLDVMSVPEYKNKLAADEAKQKTTDSIAIRQYLKKNKLKAQRTPSGLYYIIDKEGAGENAKPGQTVSVHYTGTLLDGTKFDSSRDRGEPFSFMLGKHQVIEGWDEGIGLLKKGAKARLFIPSALGYKDKAVGTIPSNSVLIFDVELMDIK